MPRESPICLGCFAVLTLTRGAYAQAAHGVPPVPHDEWSVGPSAAYVFHRDSHGGVMYGVDIAYMPTLPVWVGGGLRAFESLRQVDRTLYPYVEVGAWLYMNVGVGYSLSTREPFGGASGVHVFLGFPFPIASRVFVEPYYRPLFAAPGVVHELGLLVKWTTWDRSTTARSNHRP
jgi:hypothetical protein